MRQEAVYLRGFGLFSEHISSLTRLELFFWKHAT